MCSLWKYWQTVKQKLFKPYERQQNRIQWKVHYKQDEKYHLRKKNTNSIKSPLSLLDMTWETPLLHFSFLTFSCKGLFTEEWQTLLYDLHSPLIFFSGLKEIWVWAYYLNPVCHLVITNLLIVLFCKMFSLIQWPLHCIML